MPRISTTNVQPPSDVNTGKRPAGAGKIDGPEFFYLLAKAVLMAGGAMIMTDNFVAAPLAKAIAHPFWSEFVSIALQVAAFIGGGCLGYSNAKKNEKM